MLKVENRVVPGLEVARPDGTRAQFALSTSKDEELVANRPSGGPGGPSLEEIVAAKEALALDATDGKLDFKVGSLEIERPRYTIFWSNNSASAILLGLMNGTRELVLNGQPVKVTPSFKSWVNSTMGLESVGAPLNG